VRHFLNLADAGGEAIAAILNDAQDRKNARAGWPKGQADADAPLAGHVLAMIFEKSSTRTRVSFDMAMRQLGGSALVLDGASSQLGRGETIADTARVLSRYVDAIMIRTDDHAKVEELAKFASVPVINGLTDLGAPVPAAGGHADGDRAEGEAGGQPVGVARRWQQCLQLPDRGGVAAAFRSARRLPGRPRA
jgi:ornithine carbamoyltransferase